MTLDIRTNTGMIFSPGIQGMLYLEMFLRSNCVPSVILITAPWTPDTLLDQYPRSFWNEYIDYFDIRKPLDYYREDCEMNFLSVSKESSVSSLLTCRTEHSFILADNAIPETYITSGKQFIYAKADNTHRARNSATVYVSAPNSKEVKPLKTLCFTKPQIPRDHQSFFYDVIYTPWLCAQTLYAVLNEMSK